MTHFEDKKRMEFFKDHNNLRDNKRTPFNRLMIIFSHIEQWEVRVEAQLHLIHKVDTDCPLFQVKHYLSRFIRDGIFTIVDRKMLEAELKSMDEELEAMTDEQLDAMLKW